MRSVFGGIKDAEVFESSANINPGMHVLEVKKLILQPSRKKRAVTYFIAEFSVVQSEGGRSTTAKELPEGVQTPLSSPHRDGATVSWVQDMTKESALSNVKQFALALAPGVSSDDITEEMMLAMVNEDPTALMENGEPMPVQPAVGAKLQADAYVILTRAGGDFTKIRWTAAAA